MRARILVVHPDPSVHALLGSMLHALGHDIELASSDPVAVRMLERGGFDAVLAGVDPTDADALELLNYARRKAPHVPVLVILATGHPERARDATRMGAAAVLRYPLPATELRAAVTQALESSRSRNGDAGHSSSPPARSAAPTLDGRPAPGAPPAPARSAAAEAPALIGEDPGLKQAIETAGSIAAARCPVLIVGESGTGKAMLARQIHAQGPRRDRAFIAVECAAMGPALLERELLGHRAGGPSDPSAYRPGALSLAAGGTIFLGEVAALSPALQLQLLRVLRDGEFDPVGSTQPVAVDVRLILASREDLGALVEQGKFRQDLYYRLGVVLRMPPLRSRGGDVERLAEHFRERFARDFAKPVVGFTPDAIAVIRSYTWPGNVPELEGAIQHAVAACPGGLIDPADLERGFGPEPASHRPSAPARSHAPARIRPLKEALEEPEKQIIIEALQALSWNRQETARVLDINRTTLYKKMKKYGLLVDEPAWVN